MTTPSQKHCVFCGVTGAIARITREHAWPAWLRTSLTVTVADGIETLSVNDVPFGPARRTPPFTARPYIACEACNTGWMRALEERARPLLLPMLDGFEAVLGPEDQQVIAAWAVKTTFALTYSKADLPRLAPKAHRAELAAAEGHRPPQGTCVFLGFDDTKYLDARGAVLLSRFSPREITVQPPGLDRVAAYTLALRIHRLALLVFGSTEIPAAAGPVPHGATGTVLDRIWPPARDTVTFPRSSLGPHGGFTRLANGG